MAHKKNHNYQPSQGFRFSEINYDPQSMFAPIQGYEVLPLVSLDKAVIPLTKIVPGVCDTVKTVKEYSEQDNPTNNLSIDELASIKLYTYENQSPGSRSFYHILNESLRNEKQQQQLAPWFSYLRLFMASLSKLPIHNRTVYRGVKSETIKIPEQGSTLTWQAFSSCTTSINTLNQEQFLGKEKSRTLFIIESQSGREIQELSMVKGEAEVLIPANTQFQVVSIFDAGNDLRMVDLKEIDSTGHNTAAQCQLNTTRASSSMHKKPTGPYENRKLEQILTRFQPKSSIKLTGEALNDQDMNIVVTQAIIGKKCTGLDLMANDIRVKGASIIAGALRDNTSLENLIISYNRIGDVGVRFLTLSMNRCAVKILDLAETYLSDEGVKDIAAMLKTNRTLTHLLLNENQITDEGLTSLVKVLTEDNRTLEVLNLLMNKYITNASVDSLVNMIKTNSKLEKVDIRRCGISKTDITRIEEAFDSRDETDECNSHWF